MVPVYQQNTQYNEEEHQFESVAPSKEAVIFNHVIFLLDSNLKHMIPEKMNYSTTCEKFKCPTLDHINSLLDTVNIKKNPNKIFIMCGTNHIFSGSKNTIKMENDYMNTLEKLRNLFPLAKIYISSLLPRGDRYVKNTAQYMNDFLYGVCCADPSFTFMRNNNISRHSLVDNKHIDDDAFITLLGNIRYTLFGKAPRFK